MLVTREAAAVFIVQPLAIFAGPPQRSEPLAVDAVDAGAKLKQHASELQLTRWIALGWSCPHQWGKALGVLRVKISAVMQQQLAEIALVPLSRIVGGILCGIQQRRKCVPIRLLVHALKSDIGIVFKQQPADRHETVVGGDGQRRVAAAAVGRAFHVGDVDGIAAAVSEEKFDDFLDRCFV